MSLDGINEEGKAKSSGTRRFLYHNVVNVGDHNVGELNLFYFLFEIFRLSVSKRKNEVDVSFAVLDPNFAAEQCKQVEQWGFIEAKWGKQKGLSSLAELTSCSRRGLVPTPPGGNKYSSIDVHTQAFGVW